MDTMIDLSVLKNKKVLVCVSGGVDSMVLLDIVCRKRQELNIDVGVCHFEHGIRGRESVLDMELVQDRSRQYGVPCYVKREDIPVVSGGVNVEEVARQRRYGFFYDCLREQEADFLVLAHHRDDNCETVLMNLIRGCGIKGLCGMERVSGELCRPLLSVSKEQLYEYAKEQGIEYREDCTNADVSYFRNSIRHELMPLLKDKNPKIQEAVDRMREIAALENDFFEEYIGSLDWIKKTHYGYDIEVEEYRTAHEAIRRRTVYHVLRLMSGKDYDYHIFFDIDGLCGKETGKKVCAPHGVTIYKGEKVLSFVADREPVSEELKLKEGETKTPVGIFEAQTIEEIFLGDIKNSGLDKAYFSCDADRLTVRTRRQGDKVKLSGGGSKKLKDVFIDKKVPVFLRDFVPVVCVDDEIVWVAGVVRCGGYFVAEGSKATKLQLKSKLITS